MFRVLALIAALLAPAAAQAAAMPIKVVVVTAFELGADTGDAAGELQLWIERYPAIEAIRISGVPRPARITKDGVLVINTGMFGRARTSLAAVISDPRFDLTRAYWLMAGIAGVDPRTGSIGSAAWSDWVVDADPLYEIDDREIIAGWPWGLYAPNARDPGEKGDGADASGMAWRLDPGLTRWAYQLTRNVELPDNPKLAADRAGYREEPAAQRPPHVFVGASLGTVRFWHGELRTRWARNWVRLQTDGQGVFAMTDGEDQAVLDTLGLYARDGRVDPRRVLILRAASNYSRPPAGKPNRIVFADGGLEAGVEAAYSVGAPVVRALVAGWDRYADTLPDGARP